MHEITWITYFFDDVTVFSKTKQTKGEQFVSNKCWCVSCRLVSCQTKLKYTQTSSLEGVTIPFQVPTTHHNIARHSIMECQVIHIRTHSHNNTHKRRKKDRKGKRGYFILYCFFCGLIQSKIHERYVYETIFYSGITLLQIVKVEWWVDVLLLWERQCARRAKANTHNPTEPMLFFSNINTSSRQRWDIPSRYLRVYEYEQMIVCYIYFLCIIRV